MLPIIICRHYEVEWLDSHTCKCRNCGKRGQWTEQGFAIWIRAEPMEDQFDQQQFGEPEYAHAKVA